MLIQRSPGTISKTRLRAVVLTSLTLGAAFAVACTAPAPAEDEDDKDTIEVPSALDTDGDKVADARGWKAVDKDGDGAPDPFDINGDGTPDGPGIDTNGDGEPDAIGIDTNGDGIYDAIDTDGDGNPDEFATDEVPVGDGDGDGGDGDIVIPVGDGDGDEPSEYCDEFELEFEPRTPTVYILVDASSSMSSLGFWDPMKAGVLDVVEQLTADVRFGFGSYTGTNMMCAGLNNLTPAGTIATDNYQMIADAYNMIPAPIISSNPSEKQETPTPLAIQQATEVLLADESPGDRYILLVSDGQPDFCDDQTASCAIDATVAAMQLAFRQGIKTLVFAIESDQITEPELFDYFAQAGAGEEPAWGKGLDVMPYSGVVVGECASSAVAAEWNALRTANGNAPDPATCMPVPPMGDPNCFLPAGDYTAGGGTTTAILNSDPTALAQQILASVESLKSCVIDLNFEVINEEEGEIFVGDLDNAIAQDQWRMNTPTQMELLGDACATWQSPEVFDFFAGFPCTAIIPVVR